MFKPLLSAFGLFVTAVALSGTAFAQAEPVGQELSPEQERRAVSLYEELKCPVCKNQSIASSSSFLSEEMKQQVREFVATDEADEEILQHFVARYGDWILMRPRTTGRGLLAWVIPGVVIVVGAAWLMVALRRWSVKPNVQTAENVAATVDAAHRRRIDDLVRGKG